MNDRLEYLKTLYRCPENINTFPDSPEHNRVDGLIELCEEYITKDMLVIELGTGHGISTEVFAIFAKHVYTIDIERNEEVSDLLNRYDNIDFIQKDSVEAASLFRDKSVHFIYLDTLHIAERVIAEVDAYKPKLSSTGFWGGHDYTKNTPGVIEGVSLRFESPTKVYKDSSWIYLEKKNDTQ